MTLIQQIPKTDYRLYDGTLGTEYEAVLEAIERSEAKKRALEEHIELMRIRLETAEGHP
jgi:hypothetical protein